MSNRVAVNVRQYAQYTQRLARLIGRYRQGHMPQKTFRATADGTQTFALSAKPKRSGVVHDPNSRSTTDPLVGVLNVPAKHPIHRDLRIRQESVKRFPVRYRIHLFRKALGRVRCRQRHDLS
jgi:hypothetical protein